MKVGIALYDKTLLTSVTLASEMLLSAGGLRSRAQQRDDPIDIETIGISSATMKGGLKLHIDISYDQYHQYDILILPPMWGNPLAPVNKYPQITRWLTRQYQGGARVIATGTGVCWLAQSGLLDGQVATTHWYFYDKFHKTYPKVKLNRNAATTRTSGLYCTRSINSQTELIVYLISRYFGRDIAKVIERHYMHEVSKVSDEPYYEVGGALQYDEAVAIAQSYIKTNMSRPMTMEGIAKHCGISSRTLARRFAQQLGGSPREYLLGLRMQQAKSLLLDMNLTIFEVAELVGFKDAHYFSTLFARQFELSPKAYRQIVKTKAYTQE